MKLKLIVIIAVFIIIYSLPTKSSQTFNSFPLVGKIIYLDAGHGGKDPGANHDDAIEKEISLSIVKYLKADLEGMGATVYLTRDGDYDLADTYARVRKSQDLVRRAELINNSDSDIYISIHLNSITSSRWRGAQVFYYPNDENQLLAATIMDSLKDQLKNTDRLAKDKTDSYLLRKVDKTGVLVEVGFLSNEEEKELLKSSNYQKKVSRAIAIGIVNYFIMKL